jgi:two-component system response regulator GlrR
MKGESHFRQHILIVDDEETILELLATFFEKKGYKVTCTSTGEEALTVLESSRNLVRGPDTVDIMVLDLFLNEEDGLEVLSDAKRIRPGLPVVILTGMGFDDEILKEAQSRGARGYVSKTLPMNQLLMEVHRALDY